MDRFEGDNYILDFQVVRAAVKAFKAYSSSKVPEVSQSSPFTRFLRHQSKYTGSQGSSGSSSQPDNSDISFSWHDPHTAVYLLEQRALSAVRDYAKYEDEPDADAAQRVAKAVTEAFVAAQVEKFICDVPGQLPGQDAHVVADLLLLVRLFRFKKFHLVLTQSVY